MAVETTFSIIKPDAVAKNVINEIASRFKRTGLIESIAASVVHDADALTFVAREIAHCFTPEQISER